MIQNKFTRRIFSVIALAGLFLQVLSPVAFAKIKVPSPSQVAAELEQRYNINLQSVQDQSQMFNVANQKKTVPEVALFFSPNNPKPGDKVTATALPSFFTNETSDLYFGWYLKRDGCGVNNSPSRAVAAKCDADGNGQITTNDWKVEAMRIVVLNGFDNTGVSYSSDPDNDGYTARFGGDNKVGTANRCAAYDARTGSIYEIGKSSTSSIRGCAAGLTPVCMGFEEEVNPGTISSSSSTSNSVVTVGGDTTNSNAASSSTSGTSFSTTNSGVCRLFSYPACSSSGTVTCMSGSSLRCVSDPFGTSCGSAPTAASCTASLSAGFTSQCQHLFPKVSGDTSGDGSFGADEEEFWDTDPNDPSTADNGNKDEANIIGLGRDTFTWTYDSGDQIGVAVEGTSMILTKHDDSSSYTMWAFSKNDCPISVAEEQGAYTESVRGFSVNFPTASINLNDCLGRNLVDPAEGGQPGQIEVAVTSDTQSPANDDSGNFSGDIVSVIATLSNSTKDPSEVFYDWKVSLSNNIQFDNGGSGRRSTDITDELQQEKLLSRSSGAGLSRIVFPMNIPEEFQGETLSDYLGSDGVGYIRFSASVTENFSSGVERKGRGDVIIKYQNIGDRINAFATSAVGNPKKLVFGAAEICSGNLFLESVCSVAKNEIIGLSVSNEDFDQFHWTVNGNPLLCSSSLSSRCGDGVETNAAFLPITGDIGETYSVSVTASNIRTGQTGTFSRMFRIVEPSVEILTADQDAAWRKYLGQYIDLDGNTYDDLSRMVFQAFSGAEVRLSADFSPSFLKNFAEYEWTVDGEKVAENSDGELFFVVDKPAGSVYDVQFTARYQQSSDIRKMLRDYWNVSVFDSSETKFSKSIQLEVVDSEDSLAQSNSQSLPFGLASVGSYVPASVLFSLKAMFSLFLVLVLSGFAMALLPERTFQSRVE